MVGPFPGMVLKESMVIDKVSSSKEFCSNFVR